MRKYDVTVSYRPHWDRLARVSRSLLVSATSRETAVFEAGRRLGAEDAAVTAGSVRVESVVRV